MEVIITRAYIGMAAIVALFLATAFPVAIDAAANVSPVAAPAPSPTSDGTTIDQGIAYVLMLLALALTYIIH